MEAGFLQPGIDLVGNPFPEVGARREQRGDLDECELRSGVDEYSNGRARVVNECFSEPFVRNQPPDEQLDTALCHLCPAFPVNNKGKRDAMFQQPRATPATRLVSAVRWCS
jgi:hypothetical protein